MRLRLEFAREAIGLGGFRQAREFAGHSGKGQLGVGHAARLSLLCSSDAFARFRLQFPFDGLRARQQLARVVDLLNLGNAADGFAKLFQR